MSVVNISIGQLVTSNAGRDQANIYLVVGIEKNDYLLLVNGRERKFKNPKQKNIRHVNIPVSYTHLTLPTNREV